jgi:hypothetical protein
VLDIKAQIGKEESADVAVRQRQIDSLSDLQREMSHRLEIIDIDADSPSVTRRIQKIQPAVITND